MDGVARFFAVVEMNGPVIEDLIRFMAFTGNDDDVIGLGQFDSAVNGVAAVDDDFMVLARLQTFFDAGFDFFYDGFRIFRTGIIGRDDRDIGQFGPDASHDGTLSLIAVAAAAKDGKDAVRFHSPRRFQGFLQAVRRMGIVDDDGEILTGFDEFKTTRYGMEGLDGLVDGRFIDTFGMSRADGSQRKALETARAIVVKVLR